MFAFVIFNGDFDLPQHLLTSFADRRAEGGYGIGCVEIKDAQKVLMLKVFVWFQSATGHEGVSNADGGGVSELYSMLELIIFLKKLSSTSEEYRTDDPPSIPLPSSRDLSN
jgi:hypothetical protein